MPNDQVSDDEHLYRCVRRQYIELEDDRLRLGSLAFTDPQFRPSVDRAKLRSNDPTLTQVDPTDGVVRLIARDIRAIGSVEQRTEKGNLLVQHAIDIESVPLLDNPSHAEIYGKPEFASRGVFRKLALALAQIAYWEIVPPDLRV